MAHHTTPSTTRAALAALLALAAASVHAQTAEVRDANPVSREKFTGVISDASNTPKGDVQAMRDDGMGWGAIANALGIKLGPAVSSANHERRAESRDDDSAHKSGHSGSSGSHGGGHGRGGNSGSGGGNGGGGGKGR